MCTCNMCVYMHTLSHHLLQVKRASLVDSRTAVNDVKFAPRHLGLQLVSTGAIIPIATCYCPSISVCGLVPRLCGRDLGMRLLSLSISNVLT